MNKYHYQETLNINVEVYANTNLEAQEKVASALGVAFGSMQNLDQINQDIRDNSFDPIEVSVKQIS